MTIAYRLQISTGQRKLLVEVKVTFRPGWLKSLNWKWLKNSIKLSLISCFHSKQVCSVFYFISHLFLVFDGSVLFHFLLKKHLEKSNSQENGKRKVFSIADKSFSKWPSLISFKLLPFRGREPIEVFQRALARKILVTT